MVVDLLEEKKAELHAQGKDSGDQSSGEVSPVYSKPFFSPERIARRRQMILERRGGLHGTG